ncbi:MAG: ATP-dependent metallopeptidase FtsH/Yme1/Tma family protein, partial [Desulfohalobiaceae bacterium]
MNSFYKNLFLWATISLIMVVLFNLFNQPQATRTTLTYSEFLTRVEQGQVSSVTIRGQEIVGQLGDDSRFVTYTPEDPGLVENLVANNVQVEAEPEADAPWYVTVFVSWFPMIVLIGVWIFFMR